MPTFSAPHFTFDINLGQALLVVALSAVGYGLRKIHRVIVTFVERVDDTEALLTLVTEVVDIHSRALIAHDVLQPPVMRLHKSGRRQDDRTYFTRDNPL